MRKREERGGACDAAVVGGGVVGLSVARELARRGLSVTLVEAGRVGREASDAAAGMLAPQAEADGADDFFRLQSAGRDLYPRFAEELREETGLDIELDRTGTLYLAFTEADEEALKARFSWQARAGLPVELLTADEARELEPQLSPRVRLALRFPLDWQVENRQLVRALAASIEKYGVRVWEGVRVSGVRVERGRVVGVETSDGFVEARGVVLAAGAYSSRVPLLEFDGEESAGETTRRREGHAPAADFSAHPRIEPVRGQMLCFVQGSCAPFLRHVVYSPRGYVVPRRDGRLLAGSTTERVGFDKSVTAGGVSAVTSHALEIAPAIERLTLVDAWAGLRPCAAEDERPVIGESHSARGLFYATGHYRNGILLAPLTGEVVADMIVEASTHPARHAHLALDAFSPQRFDREFVEAALK